MSGFFSIDGRSDQQQQTESSTNLFLSSSSRNAEIYNKGIELWQQYYQFHQQRFQQQNTQDLNFCSNDSKRRPNSDNVNIVDGDIGDEHSDYNYYRSAGIKAMMDQGGSSFEGFNCQDCGNRAKKDCTHMRCRTCCKSRGFQCHTHVRSTWVPAAKRRERHQLGSSDLQHTQQQQQQLAVGDENRKQIVGGSGGGGGGFELGQFPPEVHSSADFTLVRVSSIDGAEEHLAYQTAVNIGGHTFKGILYDRGPQGRGGASLQQAPDSTAATSAPAAATSGLTNPAIMDPSTYPAQLSGFMAGTQFFLPPRP